MNQCWPDTLTHICGRGRGWGVGGGGWGVGGGGWGGGGGGGRGGGGGGGGGGKQKSNHSEDLKWKFDIFWHCYHQSFVCYSHFSWNLICVLLLCRFGMQVENAISPNDVSEIEERPQVRVSSRKKNNNKQIVEAHYSDIAWTPLRSISPTTRLFSKQLRETNIRLGPYFLPLLGKCTGDRRIPPIQGK